MKTRLEEQLYREYVAFFEKAERERRWSVFEDIPWERINKAAPDDLALAAETLCSVEMYLLDGVSRDARPTSFGDARFRANWAYEESKHSLALGEYLMRSEKRTPEELFELERRVAEKNWHVPFTSARELAFWGYVQEMATFVLYVKHRDMAARHGDEALRTVCDFIARDEIAHARYYQATTRAHLAEDREGTVSDMARVFANFEMPGVGVAPDYAKRVTKMREAGFDRGMFIQKLYIPILKQLGVTRHEMLSAQARAIGERRRLQKAPVPSVTAEASSC
jgi:acyl-[acyl-carrier-protein] desaturase